MLRLLIAALLIAATAFFQIGLSPARGPADVDLSAFTCADVTVSRLLKRVCYEPERRYLLAEIGGRFYAHCNVAEKAIGEMLEAESVPAYYLTEIRAGHRCSKSELPESIARVVAQ
jgi:hypothetical protein